MVIPARDKPAGCDDASVRRMAQDQIQDTVTKEKENSNMNKYAGTQTEKNLQEAFAGESVGRPEAPLSVTAPVIPRTATAPCIRKGM